MLGRTAFAILLLLCAKGALGEAYRAPRTAVGTPDLQGVWTSESLTVLQRPKAFKDLIATPYEAAAYEKARRERFAKGIAPTSPDAPPPEAGKVEDESAEWTGGPPGLARIRGEIRTSWIVEPADGRLPYREAARAAAEKALKDEEVYDNPEGRPFDERCLLGGGGGVAAPILNRDLIKIVQTRDSVVLFGEQNHEARIVRLRGRHAPPAVRSWMGDSIGWWEGDTLVVETTNLSPSDGWRWNAGDWIRLSPQARITERFTRTGAKEILYAYAVDDPSTYIRGWRGEMPLKATLQPLLEFACHEGNYSLTNILAGARAQEREASAAAAAK
jgi:hypothetical protein